MGLSVLEDVRMRIKKALRLVRLKLRRWNKHHYYGIDLDSRVWCWISADKCTRTSEINADPLITTEVLKKLLSNPNYTIFEWYNRRILISKTCVVYRPKTTRWYSPDKPPVQKCNSRKKKARVKAAARRQWWEKYTHKKEDTYGFDSISNVAFGHPKRMKAFGLKEKTKERNEQAYKERNIPPLSDD